MGKNGVFSFATSIVAGLTVVVKLGHVSTAIKRSCDGGHSHDSCVHRRAYTLGNVSSEMP